MKLPNGVTGFFHGKANKPPDIAGKQFKQLCFEFAAHISGKVISFHLPHSTNFYFTKVQTPDNHLFILLNQHYPFLAFASDFEFENITFIDKPSHFEIFSPFYQILDPSQLNIPLQQMVAENNGLNSAEWKQVAYWHPKTIGEVIYNFWD